MVQTDTLVFTADVVSEHVLNMENQTYGEEPQQMERTPRTETPNIDVNTRLLRYHVLQLFQTDVTRKSARTHRCQNISTADT